MASEGAGVGFSKESSLEEPFSIPSPPCVLGGAPSRPAGPSESWWDSQGLGGHLGWPPLVHVYAAHMYEVHVECLVALCKDTHVFMLVKGGAVLGVSDAGGAAGRGRGALSVLTSFCFNIKAFQCMALTFLVHQPFPSQPP